MGVLLIIALAGLSKFQAIISPIPTTAPEAGSPVSDDLQQIVNATLNLRACPKIRPAGLP
jgi:hypothetical protein